MHRRRNLLKHDRLVSGHHLLLLTFGYGLAFDSAQIAYETEKKKKM